MDMGPYMQSFITTNFNKPCNEGWWQKFRAPMLCRFGNGNNQKKLPSPSAPSLGGPACNKN